MSFSSVTKKMIDEKIKALNVAFLAKILLIEGEKAKIQPLGLVRTISGTTQKQGVITNVHIAQSARYKANSTPIEVGDVVLCVCCDRNIDAALKGENFLPPVGYHKKSDCVIVAII